MNKKGMTLVEVMVSLLILSIASLILLAGFTTVGKMISSSTIYQHQIDDAQDSLTTGKASDLIDVTTSKKQATLTVNGEEIKVHGTLKVAKDKDNKKVLSVFEVDNDTSSLDNYRLIHTPISKGGPLNEE